MHIANPGRTITHRATVPGQMRPAAGRQDHNCAMTTLTLSARARRVWHSIRKEVPKPLTPPDTYDEADIAAMLRSLGIAMLEVGQPTNLVMGRLLTIGSRYTTKRVRVVVLPTVLIIQIDTVGFTEIQMSTKVIAQLDKAGQIDEIVDLAAVGAIAPRDAIAAAAPHANYRRGSDPFWPSQATPSRRSASAW
jgi:hypothetical protein